MRPPGRTKDALLLLNIVGDGIGSTGKHKAVIAGRMRVEALPCTLHVQPGETTGKQDEENIRLPFRHSAGPVRHRIGRCSRRHQNAGSRGAGRQARRRPRTSLGSRGLARRGLSRHRAAWPHAHRPRRQGFRPDRRRAQGQRPWSGRPDGRGARSGLCDQPQALFHRRDRQQPGLRHRGLQRHAFN